MHYWLLSQKYISIKHLVYIHLRNFLSVYTNDKEISWIKKIRFPLYHNTDNTKIVYISNVVLQLSGCNISTSESIINAVTAHFAENCSQFFNVTIVPPAWIHIEVNHSTLASWLEVIVSQGLGLKDNQRWEPGIKEQEHQLFTAQYTHARCCSLIRLANREGLIKYTLAKL